MKTRIKELRQSKNLTQTALAVIIGCSQNTISRIELEEALPNADVLIETSKHFNVSIDYILCQSDIRTYTPRMSRSELPPRISEYLLKLQLLSNNDKDTVFTLIDHLSEASKKQR